MSKTVKEGQIIVMFPITSENLPLSFIFFLQITLHIQLQQNYGEIVSHLLKWISSFMTRLLLRHWRLGQKGDSFR